jgi:hypothetical protein
MIEILVKFDQRTGRIEVCAPGVSPERTALLLECAKGAAGQQALRGMQAEAEGGIQVPSPEQVRALAPGEM